MLQYKELIKRIFDEGVTREDRTGTGTVGIFGHQLRFDLEEGFPLLTTKKINFKAIMHELLWFLQGNTNIAYLNKNGVHIWNEWADMKGELGPIYGKQWRSWGGRGIDQIRAVVKSISEDPYSRRHIVSAWNVEDLGQMALPPCHILFQFYVAEGKLSCQLYQRSADIFLGLPYNIASYALLISMIAHMTDLKLGEFIHTIGDAHIYLNHIEQVKEQMTREPKRMPRLFPFGMDNKGRGMKEFSPEDFQLAGYDPHPAIKGKISI